MQSSFFLSFLFFSKAVAFSLEKCNVLKLEKRTEICASKSCPPFFHAHDASVLNQSKSPLQSTLCNVGTREVASLVQDECNFPLSKSRRKDAVM